MIFSITCNIIEIYVETTIIKENKRLAFKQDKREKRRWRKLNLNIHIRTYVYKHI